MKFFLPITLICTLLLSGCASTGRIESFKKIKEVSRSKAEESLTLSKPFFTNKKFTYLMAWNGIPVGYITASFGEISKYLEYDVYSVTLKTESNRFLSKIYKVDDVYTSYIDVNTITSRRYEADRKEGNYKKHVIVEYDFTAKKAIYTSLTDGSIKHSDIKENVQDPLSAMCRFMTLAIKVGEKINITVNLNEKNYDLYGVIERLDVIKIPGMDYYPAFRVRPYAFLGNEEYKKGSAYLYFAAGEKRYPLYGVVYIPFGKVTATLKSIEDIYLH